MAKIAGFVSPFIQSMLPLTRDCDLGWPFRIWPNSVIPFVTSEKVMAAPTSHNSSHGSRSPFSSNIRIYGANTLQVRVHTLLRPVENCLMAL
jgi:hypothetical protein